MSITRTKSPDWGVGEKLTSAQLNALDTNVTNALDKRAVGDTLSGVIKCANSSVARVVPSVKTVANADTTYFVSDGIGIVYVSGLTALRNYTLGTTSAQTGDRAMFFFVAGTSFPAVIKNAAAATLFQLGDNSRPDDDGPFAEFLFNGSDWVLFSHNSGSRTYSQTFTSSGSWVCPRGVTQVTLEGWGGGGGGGGGTCANTSTNTWCGGGGGGGAAQFIRRIVSVTPGVSYSVGIGAGGARGVGVSSGLGNPGAAGGDTTFGALATLPGASPGLGGVTASATTYAPGGYVRGGVSSKLPSSSNTGILFATTDIRSSFNYRPHYGDGGLGRIDDEGSGTGGTGPIEFMTGSSGIFGSGVGAAGSSPGTRSGTYMGGGRGGGGASGPGGAGAAGGSGGNGNNAGSGALGGNAADGAANSGSGGGGGGGAGAGSVAGGFGGDGGNGGSGKLTVIWVK